MSQVAWVDSAGLDEEHKVDEVFTARVDADPPGEGVGMNFLCELLRLGYGADDRRGDTSKFQQVIASEDIRGFPGIVAEAQVDMEASIGFAREKRFAREACTAERCAGQF